MTQTPTALDVARKALELADAKPDYVYEPPIEGGSCYYVHRDDEGDPIPGKGCLFGQALAALGVSVDQSHEHNSISSVMADEFDVDLRDPISKAMDRAQAEQDSRKPWGEAAAILRRLVPQVDAIAAVTA